MDDRYDTSYSTLSYRCLIYVFDLLQESGALGKLSEQFRRDDSLHDLNNRGQEEDKKWVGKKKKEKKTWVTISHAFRHSDSPQIAFYEHPVKS